MSFGLNDCVANSIGTAQIALLRLETAWPLFAASPPVDR